MKVPVAVLCRAVGMSRQNFYKSRRRRVRRDVDAGLVVQLVMRERAQQPRLGGLKLHRRLAGELEEAGVRLGRDRFMEVLRKEGLLIEPLPRAPRTTWSRHSLEVFPNRIAGVAIEGPNHAWASDITYLRTREGFGYLSLVTDMYSRKIVGYHVGKDLTAAESLRALEMALKEKPGAAPLIHHSDRGCQYCSHEYVERLQAEGIAISMTQTQHCAENAMAERVNGILKQEYYLKGEFPDLAAARKAVGEATWLYNTCRPHRSLNLRTPTDVHGVAA